MKILVTAKRVEDPESKIKVDAAGKGIVTEGLKYKINPFDELAIEESLRLVAKHGGEVVVVSIGTNAVHEQLRQVIAAGFSPPALVAGLALQLVPVRASQAASHRSLPGNAVTCRGREMRTA